MKILAQNKKAKYDYDILETFTAGIVLIGSEVKSAKLGNVSLKGSYVTIRPTGPKGQNEAWLINTHIAPYKPAGPQPKYDPERSRKLLLHRKEIDSLCGKLKQKGLTLVPLSMYTKEGRIKLEFGLGRGKRKYEKREKIKKREAERRMARALRK